MHEEVIAKICHEVNRAYCESIGDFSQPSWEEAKDSIKKSCIYGVKFHIEHPETTPEELHNKWYEYKKLEGWVYGNVKNIERKEHPCFVPYESLPKEQKSKDFIFSKLVKVLKDL